MEIASRGRYRYRPYHVRAAAAVLLSAVLMAVFTGAGNAAAKSKHHPGSQKIIKIGTWGPKTGPNAPGGAIQEGLIAYMNQANNKHLFGKYKVTVTWATTPYNPADTPGNVRTLIQNDKVVMVCGGQGTEENIVAKPILQSAGVANIGPAAGTPKLFSPANKVEFDLDRPYQQDAAALARFAIKTLHQTKIAVAYTTTSAGDPALQGVKWELSKHHLQLAAEVGFPFTTTDWASEAAALKASGATFVIVWAAGVPHFPALVNAAHQIGYNPTWGGGYFVMTESAVQKAANGVLTGKSYYEAWTATPKQHAIVAAAKATDPKVVTSAGASPLFVSGYMSAYACGQVLKQAAKMNGGPTKANVIAAANHLKIGAHSAIDKGLKWSKNNHLSTVYERVYAATNQGFKTVTKFKADPNAPLG